jgi:hypothetical protein
MSNDQIIEMAKQIWPEMSLICPDRKTAIAFARLIEAATREEDAAIAEDMHNACYSTDKNLDGYEIAAAIRNSGGAA